MTTTGQRRTSLWTSPTFWTWVSTASRVVAIAATLPLVAAKFPAVEAALWYLFLTLASLQVVADLGFSNVFGRFFAYAAGGARSLGDYTSAGPAGASREPNAALLQAVHATTRDVYLWIAGAWIGLAGGFGAWAASDLVRGTSNPASAALAGLAAIAATGTRLYSNRYTALLYGLSQFVPWRRVEAITWLSAASVGAASVLAGAGLLGLTGTFFGIIGLGSVAYGVLARRSLRRVAGSAGQAEVDHRVLREVLPRAWRGGLGVLLHLGVLHALTASVGRLEPAATAASYLLAYNVARAVDQFAQAPFYTKVPRLSQLRAQGAPELRAESARSMRATYWLLAAGLVGTALLAPPFLNVIGSQTSFVGQGIFAALAASIFLERYGATHLNVFMTTNRVVIHVANGVAGVLTMAMAYLLYRSLGLIGIPLASLLANALWYVPYCATKSRLVLGGDVFAFERVTSIGPAALLAAGLVAGYLVNS